MTRFCRDCRHYEPPDPFNATPSKCHRQGRSTDLVTGEPLDNYLDPYKEREPFTGEEVNTPYAMYLRCGPTGQFWKAREKSDEATPTVSFT